MAAQKDRHRLCDDRVQTSFSIQRPELQDGYGRFEWSLVVPQEAITAQKEADASIRYDSRGRPRGCCQPSDFLYPSAALAHDA